MIKRGCTVGQWTCEKCPVSLAVREIQIKVTFQLERQQENTQQQIPDGLRTKGNPCTLPMGIQTGLIFLETSVEISPKIDSVTQRYHSDIDSELAHHRDPPTSTL